MDSYDWAIDAYNEGAAFTAFDIETTGLDPQRNHIVELGAVKFDRRGPMARFSVLINPGVPMPAEASRVNRITDEMLAGKPTLDEVFPDWLRLVKNSVIVAHNAAFDTGFINEALRLRFEEAKRAAAKADAAAKAAESGGLFGDELAAGANGAAGGEGSPADKPARFKPPFPSLPNKIADTLLMARQTFPGGRNNLQDLAAALGIVSREAHRAEDDARLCMEIFIRLAGRRG